MKITFHGAGMEVGRSCIEVSYDSTRFLLDAGLKITPTLPEFPIEIKNISEISYVFVSHIHLDHTGSLPRLYSSGLSCPIYMSPLTTSLLPILLKDSWKVSRIEKFDVGYNKNDIFSIKDLVIPFSEDDTGYAEVECKNFLVKTYNAGHVPGARSFLFEFEDISLLYSGDFHTQSTQLTQGLSLETYPKDVDVLIIESTYGDRDHPDREELKNRFFQRIESTLSNEGSVLIPTFSIGRAQELLIELTTRFSVPIYFDGMAKRIAEVFVSDSSFIKNKELLQSALNQATIIQEAKERTRAKDQPCIIITTSGMMDGGPVLHYLPFIAKDEKSALLLTGYQAEGTNGRCLLEKGFVVIDDKRVVVNCYVEHFDFSAHAGRKDILRVIESVNPRVVILNHGEASVEESLQNYLKEKNINCFMPKTGEVLDLDSVLSDYKKGGDF